MIGHLSGLEFALCIQCDDRARVGCWRITRRRLPQHVPGNQLSDTTTLCILADAASKCHVQGRTPGIVMYPSTRVESRFYT